MKKFSFVVLCILLFICSTTNSQSLYIDKDNNATGLAVEYQSADGEWAAIGSLSMSGKGIVDFGVFYGRMDNGYTIGTGMELFALKQSESVPISFSFRTSFFLISKTYEFSWLENTVSKTFYSVGVSLYRQISVSEKSKFHPTLFTTYQNSFESGDNNSLAGGVGFSYEIESERGNAFLINAAVAADEDVTTVTIGIGYLFLR